MTTTEATGPGEADVDRPRKKPRRIVLKLLPAVVVAGALVALDWYQRNAEMSRLMSRAQVAERAMFAYMDSEEKIYTTFSESSGSRERLDEALDGVRAAAGRELTNLLVARQRANDTFVMPWHRDIARARARYGGHMDAWEGYLRDLAKSPETVGEAEPPEITATFKLACSSLRRALTPVPLYDLEDRVEEMCES